MNCDDGYACTLDSCDSAAGCQHVGKSTLCNDGIYCTKDICVAENGINCTFEPVDLNCDDGVACTADSCSPEDGGCTNYPQSNWCPDDDPCKDAYCSGQGCVYYPVPVVEMEPRIPARPAMTEIRSVEMDAIASVFWNSIAPTIAFRKIHSPWMPWKNSRRAMELSSISSEIPLHCTETPWRSAFRKTMTLERTAEQFLSSGGTEVWIEEQKITPEDAQAGDAFGHSVAINHNRIVVGAPRGEPMAFSCRSRVRLRLRWNPVETGTETPAQ